MSNNEIKLKSTKDIGGLRKYRSKDSQVAGRNGGSSDNGALVALDKLRLPRSVEAHPKPRSPSLLLPLPDHHSSTNTRRNQAVIVSIIGIGGVVEGRGGGWGSDLLQNAR